MMTYTLTTPYGVITEIKEPIGFDNLQIVLERNKDSHGIYPTSSVGELEFYGVAADIIRTAYNTDIDTEITFTAKQNDVIIYSGIIVLASYSEKTANYCSILVKVGEIGVKTTFNNRMADTVEIDSKYSIDGEELVPYSNLKKTLTLPSKAINWRNIAKIKESFTTNQIPLFLNLSQTSETLYYKYPVEPYISEIEEFNANGIDLDSNGIPTHLGSITSFSDSMSIFTNKSPNILSNDFDLTVRAVPSITEIKFYFGNTEIPPPPIPEMENQSPYSYYKYFQFIGLRLFLVKIDENGNVVQLLAQSNYLSGTAQMLFQYNNNTVRLEENEKIAMYYSISGKYNSNTGLSPSPQIRIRLHFESYGDQPSNISDQFNIFRVSRTTITPKSNTKISLIFETLSRLTEIICGKTVKSNWYGRPDSNINPTNVVGGGALKAISTGFEIREANLNMNESNSDIPKPKSISFKDLFTSLSAIDNIGYGWEQDENGELYLRLERWNYFYKPDLLLIINNPNKKIRDFNGDNCYVGIDIGYEKYETAEIINSIDSFHTKLSFKSPVKSIQNILEKLSKFIADPYTIELTRNENNSSKWKYDENFFIFELKQNNSNAEYDISQGVQDHDNTFFSPDTYYNFRISPHRNALRLAERLFQFTLPNNILKFLSGEGNIYAKGKPKIENGFTYLEDSGDAAIIAENDNIQKINPVLKSEIIKFEYPLCFDDYNKIMANPYGIIRVDGEDCYILKITYKLNDRLAAFELIPIATN